MKIEIIRAADTAVVLDGSGNVLADIEWPEYMRDMPYKCIKVIEDHFAALVDRKENQ